NFRHLICNGNPMAKIKLTNDLLVDILAHIPEGFIHRSLIARRLSVTNRDIQMDDSRVARDGEYFYDPNILSQEALRQIRNWARPSLPDIRGDETVVGPTITQRREERDRYLETLGENAEPLMQVLAESEGYLTLETVQLVPNGEGILPLLLESGALKQIGIFI